MRNSVGAIKRKGRFGYISLVAAGLALAVLAGVFCLNAQGNVQKAYAAGEIGAASMRLDAQASVSVPNSAQRYKGHYYKIYYYENGAATDWALAKKYCAQKGGHLATITSSGEQAFLDSIKGSNENLWLGGYCTANHVWKWVTGEKWKYTNWKYGEPSYSYSDTENKLGTFPSTWNDFDATSSHDRMDGYICEWDYSLTLSDSKLALSVGDKTYVTYSLEGPNGTASAKATWKSSNKSVAKVSSKGMIVAKRAGSCKVTCKVKGITKTVKVVVKPKKVTGLKALSKSRNFVQLQWAKQAGVSKYQVYYYDPDVMEYTLAKTVKGSLNTARVTGLSKSTTYKFKVRGVVKAWSKSYKGSFSKVYKVKTTR